MKKILFFILSSVLLLNACGMTFKQTSLPLSGEQIAVITTNMGVIKFKFFPQYAPETVKSFIELAKKGFYDGLIFHRVVPGFVIQNGDPTGDGTGGETYKGPGTTLKAEISKELSHIYGAVAMARKGGDLNSATSQFYIVQNRDGAASLDGQYTIFGQVFEGIDVVDKIARVPRDSADKPLASVVMEKVAILP
ncbi:peptidylprolyl isomerase [Candidatus Peregrinibacteria bacterium]|nr:peptidylprolyl isomerase [Candidatus Peregrinibacteria bacterium]